MNSPGVSWRGEIPRFLAPRLGWFTRRQFLYGDAIRIGVWGRQLLLTHPEDVFHLLVTNASNYSKSRELTSQQAQQRVGKGLLGRQGTAHHDRRRVLQPLYSQRNVGALLPIIKTECRRLTSSWRAGETRDLAQDMARLARRVLLTALFGELNFEEIAELEQAIRWRRLHTERVYFSRVPRYGKWPTGSRQCDRRAQAVFAKFVRSRLQNSPTQISSGQLLAGIQAITLPDGKALTEEDVCDEVLALMSTGHETIAEWLTWCWVMLAQHPKFTEAWRAEIGRLGPVENWWADAAECAPLTHGLLEESLRLYPPTWIFARVPSQDDELPSGTMVQAGQNLLLCPYLMHRHPGFYADPERFDPRRSQAANWPQLSGRTFFPFGAGAHRCIGDKLARLETVIALVTIAREFDFQQVQTTCVRPHPGLTLGVRGGFAVRISRVEGI
jgi:cytochrome P450